jgi:hypothetical protein
MESTYSMVTRTGPLLTLYDAGSADDVHPHGRSEFELGIFIPWTDIIFRCSVPYGTGMCTLPL